MDNEQLATPGGRDDDIGANGMYLGDDAILFEGIRFRRLKMGRHGRLCFHLLEN
jgi:hypothetical protein